MSTDNGSRHWVSWLDGYITPRYHEDVNRLYRARLLVGITLVLIVGLGTFLLYMRFLAQTITPESQTATALMVTPMILLLLLLLITLRYWGLLRWLSHALLGVSCVLVFLGMYLSGGPAQSPATVLSIVPMLIGFCLTGLYGGLLWATVSLAGYAVMVGLVLSGHPFPRINAPENLLFDMTYNWMLAFSVSVLVLLVYELMSQHLSWQLRLEKEQFRHLATHDPLTGLANRSRFDDELERAINRASHAGSRVGLFYLDLDGFKPINDALGHDVGDRVLQIIAERLAHRVRRSDTVARLGGDEFAVLLDGVSADLDLEAMASELLAAVARPIPDLPGTPSVTGSLGVAMYPEDAADGGSLVRRADQAMYRAKREHGIWVLARNTV